MLGDDLLGELGPRVPVDHAAQVLADAYIEPLVREAVVRRGGAPEVADLGCGPGDSVDAFRLADPDVRWVGVDLPASPEVATRTRTDAEFRTFDGVAIPFEDASLDLIFCKQVLEHVERPGPLLADVGRVLRPVGLTRLIEAAGMHVEELRPGIDALTLIVRRGLGGPQLFRRWWARESPLNRTVGAFGRARRLSMAQTNAIKLLLCGQFCFVARRTPDG